MILLSIQRIILNVTDHWSHAAPQDSTCFLFAGIDLFHLEFWVAGVIDNEIRCVGAVLGFDSKDISSWDNVHKAGISSIIAVEIFNLISLPLRGIEIFPFISSGFFVRIDLLGQHEFDLEIPFSSISALGLSFFLNSEPWSIGLWFNHVALKLLDTKI